MNFAKTLKAKRDAEERLRRSNPAPAFVESTTGEQSFESTGDFATKTELNGGLAGKADIDHTHAFLDLTDTPDSYVGQAGKVPFVKATEDGFEFKPAGAGGTGAFDYGLITSPVDIQFDYGGIAA